jgi:hypothetical protein
VDHWGFAEYHSTVTVTPETWNHVAMTFDGSTIKFYVNGQLAGSGPGQLYNYNVNTYDIGGNVIAGTTTKPSFNGLIDEVTLYNRPLSGAEIQSIYDAGAAGKHQTIIGSATVAVSRQPQLDPNPVPVQGLGPTAPMSQRLFGATEQSLEIAPPQSRATVQADQPDTTRKPARASAALPARDAVLETWSDPLADLLAGL